MSNKDEASSSEELKQNQETNTVTLDEYEKIKDDYLRLAADFENFKKRNEKEKESASFNFVALFCLLYTSPSPRDGLLSRMPSSA